MNKARRASLMEASGLLDRVIEIVSDARYDEQECLDNMPENLEGSDRYASMESAVDQLENALDLLGDANNCITEAIA